MGERAEEVVVEADARLDVRHAGAVEVDGHRHVGLAGRAPDRDPAAVADDEVEGSERSRHRGCSWVSMAWAAAIRRSLPVRSRIVRRRQWASGWPAPNVRGTRPRRSRPVGGGGGSLGGSEVDEQEVRDGRAHDQPADAQARSASRSRSASTRATLAAIPRGSAERLGHDGHADRGHGARRPIRRDPGDRRGPGDRESRPAARPARRPCSAVRTTTRLAWREPEVEQRGADELGVGLVEDDDRPRPAGRVGIGGDAVEQRPRSYRPARADRSGCSGCTARRRRRPGSRPRRGQVEGVAGVRAEARDDDGRRAALLGDDAVHRVRRCRDHGPTARRAGTPCR